MNPLPIIDMSPLYDLGDRASVERVALEIRSACRKHGFFYVLGHGIPFEKLVDLEAASRKFFDLSVEDKNRIAMRHGGIAWRGYFPVGGELTSGRPDMKEGLYFGTELALDHPRVLAGTPLHGPNLWPESVPELRGLVLDYMAATSAAAQTLLRGMALSLDLPNDYFTETYTRNPTILFRIFNYPAADDASWGVGEHTDYGLLTLLAQDRLGGLQVKSREEWIEAPPVDGTLVCNIGDVLDRLTGGWYRSTPHRVRNSSGHARLSFPLFFDPDFDAEMQALPTVEARGPNGSNSLRWDDADLHAFTGTYGSYLIDKVSKVFPQLSPGRFPPSS
jgi:isopenicillin N synthase-like dioxygenase